MTIKGFYHKAILPKLLPHFWACADSFVNGTSAGIMGTKHTGILVRSKQQCPPCAAVDEKRKGVVCMIRVQATEQPRTEDMC